LGEIGRNYAFAEHHGGNWEKVGESPKFCNVIRGDFDVNELNYRYKGCIHIQNLRISCMDFNYRYIMVAHKKFQIWVKLDNFWKIAKIWK
jgi:hypothetical protein